MKFSKLIAKHLRDLYFGGNWSASNFRDVLATIDWQQANRNLNGFNSIATLVFHTNYYIKAILNVFENGVLNAKDELSFIHPILQNETEWKELISQTLENAEKLAQLIENMPDDMLTKDFTQEKYGNYYRNLLGLIEHAHYHLGQIAILKKL